MKKLITVTVLALFLLGSVTLTALGNSYSLGAENGKLLEPAGLSLELASAFQQNAANQATQTPGITAQLSYGISPSITLTGQLAKSAADEYQTMIKAYLSPMHEGMGYTVYLGYDLTNALIPMYGVSLWSDTKFLYSFVNLESKKETESTFTVTPGANLRLGSKLRVGGEAQFNPDSWGCQELRVGGSFALTRNVLVKADYQTNLENHPTRVYSTGVAVQF